MQQIEYIPIEYIPIARLHPHKDNPRKTLGDLAELADSIRANGILQNLTVVADGDVYTVIIGHRRLAAAKQAGLDAVPCVVAEMTEQEQLRTMLMENMQRSDLTVYEQAQGFQLLLDFGETVEQIAEASGFSQSTVRRRVKLLELDKEKFEQAALRGATLFDFAELDKIEDTGRRNRVLAAAGTKNFKLHLQTAIDEEKTEKLLAGVVAAVSPFAVPIEQADHGTMTYVKNYHRYNIKDGGIELPEDIRTARYYYVVTSHEVDLYRDKADDPADPEAEKRAAERAQRIRAEERANELREIAARHYRLRKEFIKNFGGAKSHVGIIAKYAATALYWDYRDVDLEPLEELMGISIDDKDVDIKGFHAQVSREPEYALLALTFCSLDDERSGYFGQKWDFAEHRMQIGAADNDRLDLIYALLRELGYEMSDEELQMQRGTHPLLGEAADEPTPCERCRAAHPGCDKCCRACGEQCNASQECRMTEGGGGA